MKPEILNKCSTWGLRDYIQRSKEDEKENLKQLFLQLTYDDPEICAEIFSFLFPQ